MNDFNAANQYRKFLESRGLKLELYTNRHMSEPVYRTFASVNLSNAIKIYAAGLSEEEAEYRAILKLAADLEFNKSLSSYYMDSQGCSQPLAPFEKLIDMENCGELFSNELNSIYDLESWSPEAFTEPMTCDSSGIRAEIFTNDSNGEKTAVSFGWLKTVFGFDCIGVADSQSKATEKAYFSECERYITNQLLVSPIPLLKVPDEYLPDDYFILSDWCSRQEFKLSVYDASLNGKYPSAVAAVLFRQIDQKARFCVCMGKTTKESVRNAVLEVFDAPIACDTAFHEITFDFSCALTASNINKIALNISGYLPADLFSVSKDNAADAYYDSHPDRSVINTDREITMENILDQINEDCDIQSGGYTLEFDREGLFFCWKIRPGYSEISDATMFDAACQNIGNIYREFILNMNKRLDDYGEFFSSLKENEIPLDTGITKMLGILTNKTNNWNSLTLAELLALIEMKTGNFEAALNHIEIYLEDISFEAPDFVEKRKRNFYRCCRDILRVRLDNEDEYDFRPMLISLYGKFAFEMSESTCNGSSMFNYNFNGEYLNQIPEHMDVIKNYTDIRKALCG
jgi:ribosomal protein S12 methylthiotransferase accessory factor